MNLYQGWSGNGGLQLIWKVSFGIDLRVGMIIDLALSLFSNKLDFGESL